MGNRLEVILSDNSRVSRDTIQVIAEDFIEWQNE